MPSFGESYTPVRRKAELFFSQQYLDELRARSDLVEIVGRQVPLTKKGKRYWACCPFHGEKTASFTVDPDKQMYYCFGCHAAGNVIGFVMAMHRLDFVDAVKLLAEQANMPLPEVEDEQAYRRERAAKERLYAANKLAARFYFDQLFTPAGNPARAYLEKRGISERGIRRFGLGYAPGGETLCKYLKEQGFTDEQIALAGLSRSGERGDYDQFRDRVMFPIIDPMGRVVGFGGRVMGDGHPKYLNTSDTAIFNKRHQLYGINLLKKQRDIQRAIVVEGYMDVIGLELAGVAGAVASLGTALTQEQARLIRRYTNQALIAYDGDSAGQNAMLRGLDILEGQGLDVRVVVLPDGQDPDDLARSGGQEAFDALAQKALPLAVFKMKRAALEYDLATQQGRTAYAMAASKILAEVKNPVERESYVKLLQVETGFSISVLADQVRISGNELQRQQLQRDNYAAQRNNKGGNSTQTEVDQGINKAQEEILTALLAAGSDALALMALVDVDFPTPQYARALDIMRVMLADGERLTPAAVSDHFTDDPEGNRQVLQLLVEGKLLGPDLMATVRQAVQTIKSIRIQAQINALKERADSPDMDEAERRLAVAEIVRLTRMLKPSGARPADG